MQHILSARQFDQEQLGEIFERTDYMWRQDEADKRGLADTHRGETAITLFYEASTRTRLSFEVAAQKIGMGYAGTENADEFSSAVKGETLEDTIRTAERLGSVVILRHKEEGAAERAAAVATRATIINAGDGGGEHPTQALTDLSTIRREKGRLENLTVSIGGDLVKGRTARSLAMMLSLYKGNHINFVSLPKLRIGEDVKAHLEEAGTTYSETEDMHDAIRHSDVVYWTRLQLERHKRSTTLLQRLMMWAGFKKQEIDLNRNYVIDQTALQTIEDDTIIMHPLPRNNEISVTVDDDQRAKYFDQVENGKYVRMALLDMILRQ